MLVLTRGVDEAIVISHPGGPIRVIVSKFLPSGKVRIAVEAPDTVRVDRQEIHELREGKARFGT